MKRDNEFTLSIGVGEFFYLVFYVLYTDFFSLLCYYNFRYLDSSTFLTSSGRR